MSKRIFLLLFIIAFSLTPTVKGSYNHTELRNNFTSDQWYQSSHEVYRNNTYYVFNLTGGDEYFNYTDFTEYESTFDIIDLNDTHIHFKDSSIWRSTLNHWVVEEYNTSGDFNINFDLIIIQTGYNSNQMRIIITALTNATEDYYYVEVNDLDGVYLTVNSYQDVSHYTLRFYSIDNGVKTFSDYSNDLNVQTWYYLSFNRTGSTYNIDIYSNPQRTLLIEHIEKTVLTNIYNFNKFYQVQNCGYGTYTNVEGYIKNGGLKQETSNNNGTLYFKNLLDNTTSLATWYLSNQELSGGLLNVSFSNNNITWVGETALSEGYNAVNLEPYNYTDLYVKYDFMPGSDAPRLNNASVMYQGSTGTGGPTTTIYVYRYGVAIILLILGVMFGLGIKRE